MYCSCTISVLSYDLKNGVFKLRTGCFAENLYIESLFHKRKKIDKGKRLKSWDFQQLSALAGTHMYVMHAFINLMYVWLCSSERP